MGIFKNNKLKSQVYIAIFIMCLGGFISFIQFLPSKDTIYYRFLCHFNYLKLLNVVGDAFFPSKFFISDGLANFLSLFTLSIIILFLIQKPVMIFLIFTSYSALFYIFMFVNSNNLRHHGFILITLVFILWINENYNKSIKIRLKNKLIDNVLNFNLSKYLLMMMNLCLVISVIYTSEMYYKEIKYFFSGAKDIATFIVRSNLDKNIIVAHRIRPTSALLPYLPGVRFWYASIEDYGTFIDQEEYSEGNRISNLEVIARAAKAFQDDKKDILFLFSSPLNQPELYGLKLLYKTDKKVFGYGKEKFYLYGRAILKNKPDS